VDRQYRCTVCGGEFVSERPDGDAIAESDRLFGGESQDWAVLCDVCFKQVMLHSTS
jgi:hypothetical protein